MTFIIRFLKKDILFSRNFLFFWLVITALFPVMLGWYAWKATPFLSAGSREVTAVLYFPIDFFDLCIMTMLSGIFLIGMNVQTEKATGSFRVLLALPLSREQLFWARVLSALVWGLLPVTFGYLGLWLMRSLGYFSDNPLIALIAKPDFFALLIAFDLLLAAIFVGLSLFTDGRLVLALLLVLLLSSALVTKIVLNPVITGLSRWSVMPVIIETLSRVRNLAFLVVALALLVGFAMSAIFKHKKSYL